LVPPTTARRHRIQRGQARARAARTARGLLAESRKDIALYGMPAMRMGDPALAGAFEITAT